VSRKDRDPTEEKILDYQRHRTNAYGENDKSSLKAIRFRKAWVNRSYRRGINAATAGSDIDQIDEDTSKVEEASRCPSRRRCPGPDVALGRGWQRLRRPVPLVGRPFDACGSGDSALGPQTTSAHKVPCRAPDRRLLDFDRSAILRNGREYVTVADPSIHQLAGWRRLRSVCPGSGLTRSPADARPGCPENDLSTRRHHLKRSRRRGPAGY
jgi:hypothetical protein